MKPLKRALKEIREDNGKRLEEMRKTVDEKLQDTLEKRFEGESFKQVKGALLEQVQKASEKCKRASPAGWAI